jgi:hypothetical protein
MELCLHASIFLYGTEILPLSFTFLLRFCMSLYQYVYMQHIVTIAMAWSKHTFCADSTEISFPNINHQIASAACNKLCHISAL